MLASLSNDIYFVRKNVMELEAKLDEAHALDLEKKTAFLFKTVKPQMEHVRKHIDALESVMPDDRWLLPKYREMLFIS